MIVGMVRSKPEVNEIVLESYEKRVYPKFVIRPFRPLKSINYRT